VSGTNLEIEVKIRFEPGAAAARERIEHAGFTAIGPRALESDTVFDRGEGDLRAASQLLRLRRGGPRALVTYKGPPRPGRYKSREEIEFHVPEPDALVEVLDRLGYRPSFRYEKYRTKFQASGERGIVSIDETPIGVFLELEGEPQWIDRAAAKLGFAPDAYVLYSYASLYQKYLLTNPGAPADMTFGESPSLGH